MKKSCGTLWVMQVMPSQQEEERRGRGTCHPTCLVGGGDWGELTPRTEGIEGARPPEAGVQAQAPHHTARPGLPLIPINTLRVVPLLTGPLAR